MSWTEAQIDELIDNVKRDFALGRFHHLLHLKLQRHGVTMKEAEKTISKHSYVGQYETEGRTIAFLNPRNNVFVAWSPDTYPTYVKTGFIANAGLNYLLRQAKIELIWSPW